MATIVCRSCGAQFRTAKSLASGAHLKCPKCGERFSLPAEDVNDEFDDRPARKPRRTQDLRQGWWTRRAVTLLIALVAAAVVLFAGVVVAAVVAWRLWFNAPDTGPVIAKAGGVQQSAPPQANAPTQPPKSSTPPVQPAKGDPPRPEIPKPPWTLDISQMKIPDTKASGKIHDADFMMDKAELKGGILELRQGKDFFATASVEVFLFLKEDETIEGKTFKITPGEGFSGPHVHLKWTTKGQPFPTSQSFFSDKYAMILEFGKAKDNVIPGKIYVCVNDETKTSVAGTFTLGDAAEQGGGGEISGKITLRGDAKGLWVTVGCLGKNSKGELESPGVGFELGSGTTSASCTTWAPRNTTLAWDQKTGGGTHKHVNRPPGRYLVYLRARAGAKGEGPISYEGYLDWKWVEIKDDKSKVSVDLTIDPSNQGNLEVQVAGAPKDAVVTYLPLDADGKLPLPDAHRYMGDSTAKLEGGKVVIHGLREGKYQVAYGNATADVEVKRGTTASVQLTAKK